MQAVSDLTDRMRRRVEGDRGGIGTLRS